MARNNNKECVICHTIYSYCPDCNEYAHEPFWKNMFCSERCLNTYDVFNKYVSEVINKEQAQARLRVIGVDTGVSFHGSFAKTYAEIMGYNEHKDQSDKMEKNTEDLEKRIAFETKDKVITNATAEAKAIYPKSVKNKKRY